MGLHSQHTKDLCGGTSYFPTLEVGVSIKSMSVESSFEVILDGDCLQLDEVVLMMPCVYASEDVTPCMKVYWSLVNSMFMRASWHLIE